MTTDYSAFFLGCVIVLAVLAFFCLVRTIRGPKLADRIMGTNMIGTITIAIILLLSVYLDETSVLDIALIYAIMSFVAVIVLTKIYIGLYREYKEEHLQEDHVTERQEEKKDEH
ncbi:MAG: monovalent cation/H+ antiporter complex subunit F [Clostridiales bacterium]|nr:monovalent cation/H+ antiporter complex subunit F [Clostridiales bacterium]